ncbi:MAG: amidohydrolase family protein [Limisphaerales bacterium]
MEILPPGHRPLPLGIHALVGGKVVVKPGEVLDPATIVIRDGLIERVGRDLQPPPDARLWDMKGLTIYAGFIDPYLSLAATEPPVTTSKTEPILTSGGVNFYGVPGQERDPGSPGPGDALPTVTPENRVAKSFAPDTKTLQSLRELGFTAANVVPTKGIVRGTSAFVALSDVNPNDAILKADVFQHIAFDADGGRENGYPASLMGVIAAVRQTFFDAQHYALDQADYRLHPEHRKRPEFNPALEALAPALDRHMPVVFEPGSSLMVDRAVRVAGELGLSCYLLSSGQEWRRPGLAKAAGVPFIVPLHFPAVSKMPEDDDWNDVSLDELRAWDWAPENPALLHQQGIEIALTTYGLSDRKGFRKNLQQALDRGLPEAAALAALTVVPARLCGLENRLGTIEAGKVANLTVVAGDSYFDPKTKVRGVWIDGRNYPSPPESAEPPKNDAPKPAKSEAELAKDIKAKEETKQKQADQRALMKKRVAHPPQEGRGPIAQPPAVLVEDATIWTCGPEGRLEDADLLVVGGKIKAVGRGLNAQLGLPDSTLKIDGHGKQVTPGIIDAHSHSMILGAVNEGTIPSSAMVRVGDVVNADTENIHEQLAGGVTTVNLLHGSANPIGGQNCVIKLRDGAPPEDLKFTEAPPGIKFALGENVKQSNWGERNTSRFPQTRMGVQTFLANRFTAAQQYLKDWEGYRKSGGVPPRRDLELEAIGEILQHQRWIHCHSYRQDEVLMLLRLMERFGVQVGTLQHILEGYKVADEIAAHGAGASTFSDWWAYKFEVYDAIPYNGSLMRERGVLVSFNSDSSDLARRLYLEAAKAVKYGGTPEIEALKFVTLNPAKQLRLGQRVGSLEPGKDADFVIWSKSPLDSATVCLETWVDGKKYFARSIENDRASALEKERAALIEKAKKVLAGGTSGEAGAAEKKRFFERAWEHRQDGMDRHCLDDE